MRIAYLHLLFYRYTFTSVEHNTARSLLYFLSGCIGQCGFYCNHPACRSAILYLRINKHLCLLLRYLIKMHKHSAAGHFIGFERICYAHIRFTNEPHITIDATVMSKVECVLRFTGRIVLIVAIVGHYGQHTFVTSFDTIIGQVH
ncbi:hypothetical protein SDC9_212513 [bioreactor metagenome]|uniref:Uncharacterized protein n=1 Tax=bioreactor metagenome TaxID=1076179 RepID=A0A645JMX1_9ZZZZ